MLPPGVRDTDQDHGDYRERDRGGAGVVAGQRVAPPIDGARGILLPRPWPRPVLVGLACAAVMVVLLALVPPLAVTPRDWVARATFVLSGICPQRLAHSYTLAAVQLPIEARMLGIFAGFTLGVLELATIGRHRSTRWPRRPLAFVLLLGFATMAFDGTNALFYDLGLPHAYAPDLRLRLATGLLAGIALAFGLVPGLAEVLGIAPADASADPRWRDLGWTYALALLFGLLVPSGWPPLLIPAATVAEGGVLLVLCLTNGLALAGFASARHIARGTWPREWALGAGAAALAAAELLVFALLRHAAGGW